MLQCRETEEEGLFLRRIADFWQEGEYQIAKTQMEQFIGEYPESPFSDALCAALGDLFLREKNFSTALEYYAQVKAPEFYDRVFLNRMQCLYEMGWYATLADECEEQLKNGPNLHVTYFLAIGLYHQCINASKETEQLQGLAERAKPFFEILYQSELGMEVSQGYAHLLCILKEYEKATEIYLTLAEKDPSIQEEMLFQVALIQSEYDKELALQTFHQIENLNQSRAKEAAYNRMVLTFDLGKFEELAESDFIERIPSDRVGTARLFLGRSLLNLKEYEKALVELKAYIENAPVSETLYAALLSLLDASFQCDDIASLDEAIAMLKKNYPEDPELPKAYFSRAQLLKRGEDIFAAKEQLESLLALFPKFEQKPQVMFELTHLSYKGKDWKGCYRQGAAFLDVFSSHELAPFAWRYFISSSAEIGREDPSHRHQLLKDLESFLTLPLTDIERSEWELMLAKTHFEMNEYEKAIGSLKSQKTPNAKLLRALCERDGHQNLELFCQLAEEALNEGANLVDHGQIHASLYNGYLELSQVEKSAEHLMQAFMHKAEIKLENLLWLADHYYNSLKNEEGNFVLAARTATLLDTCIQEISRADDGVYAALPLEPIVCKLARVYSILGRIDDEIALLESLKTLGDESKLLLAECYAKKGTVVTALHMFDEIVAAAHSLRTPIAANAALESARIKLSLEAPNLNEIALQLKNLVLQKNFEAEPSCLEAALEYIDLQAPEPSEKRLALFKKTKEDFERTDDLLSMDYHAARKQSQKKDKMYQSYMLFLDANLMALESNLHPENKDLKAMSKDLLLRVRDEPSTTVSLMTRVRKLLADET